MAACSSGKGLIPKVPLQSLSWATLRTGLRMWAGSKYSVVSLPGGLLEEVATSQTRINCIPIGHFTACHLGFWGLDLALIYSRENRHSRFGPPVLTAPTAASRNTRQISKYQPTGTNLDDAGLPRVQLKTPTTPIVASFSRSDKFSHPQQTPSR